MAIPKPLTHPVHRTKLPSTGRDVKFRPFLMKEEKILLLALSGGDPEEETQATKQILRNCILEEDIDIEKLPMFDVEWLFLQARIHSKGNTVDIVFSGIESSECESCRKKITKTIDLSEVVCEGVKDNNKIALREGIGLLMKYPTASLFDNQNEENSVEQIFNNVCCCIDTVYTSDSSHTVREEDYPQVLELLESLTTDEFELIQNYFDMLPICKLDVELICPDCGNQTVSTLRGLHDFFD